MAVDARIGGKVIRFLSIYLPHAGYSWKEFEECFEDIGKLCMEAIDKNFSIIIGRDFKASFSAGVRGTYLRNFCFQFNLNILGKLDGPLSENNWTFQSALGEKRRINYILY